MKFFSTESGFYKFISRLWDVFILNILWVVCSLPIVTIGVSTTAAYTVALKMIEDKEGYVARGFFKAFRQNLKQGFGMSVIVIIFSGALYVDFMFSGQIGFFILGLVSAFLFCIAIIYTFPLLARYENTLFRTIRNSMRISMRYLGRTFVLIIVIVFEFLLFNSTAITRIVGIFIGPVCVFMTVSGMALHLFKHIEKEGGVVTRKTEEDIYNEEIERETEEALKKEEGH